MVINQGINSKKNYLQVLTEEVNFSTYKGNVVGQKTNNGGKKMKKLKHGN